MSEDVLQFCDGSHLSDVRYQDGRPRGIDSQTGKRGTYHGDGGGGRLVDHNGKTIREITPRSAVQSTRPASASSSPPKSSGGNSPRASAARSADRKRWVTLNTFVDRVARHLDAHEVAVWLVVFRWTQDDHAELRIADIAARLGKSCRAVQRAIDRLLDAGLLERMKRGTRQGGPSRYRLEPDPAVALPRLATDAGSQHDAGDVLRAGPKHTKRDRRGAFTT